MTALIQVTIWAGVCFGLLAGLGLRVRGVQLVRDGGALAVVAEVFCAHSRWRLGLWFWGRMPSLVDLRPGYCHGAAAGEICDYALRLWRLALRCDRSRSWRPSWLYRQGHRLCLFCALMWRRDYVNERMCVATAWRLSALIWLVVVWPGLGFDRAASHLRVTMDALDRLPVLQTVAVPCTDPVTGAPMIRYRHVDGSPGCTVRRPAGKFIVRIWRERKIGLPSSWVRFDYSDGSSRVHWFEQEGRTEDGS